MRTITSVDIERFRTFLYEEEKSKNTLEKYTRDLTVFQRWLSNQPVAKQLVLAYKKEIIEKYAPASVNSMLSSLNAFFAFMDWHDCRVKTLKIQRQIFTSKEKELTKEEYERLLKAAKERGNQRLNLLIQTICGTGIRVSELEYITVEAVRSGDTQVSLKGKIRAIFIVPDLQKKLLQYAREQGIISGPVFITKKGRPISRTNIWRMMKDLCTEACVDPGKVFPHNLRHLFARIFYGVERDIVKLADVLGHSNINTTRIYIISTGSEHRRLMKNMRLII